MKWTFKSHKGFFIPVICDGEIKGLRIHLEEKYKLETTDIWFSSRNEYQGASTNNSVMIFMPENDRISIYDINNVPKKDIIITSEFLLGYRLFNRDKKITIAIPNRITKRQGQIILNNINIDNVEVYIDKHTLKYDNLPIYKNFLNYIPENKQTINFVFDYKELIKDDKDASLINIA